MSRISCDVTRDLLTVYLDEVCSEESRELVDEHLQECRNCRDFLEAMKVTDIKENCKNKQFQFFKKAKQQLDNRYKLFFFIALLFTALMVIYSELYYYHIPEIFINVSIPVLMVTFFLAQPTKQNKVRKYHLLQLTSAALSVFLIGFHLFAVGQLTLLLNAPNDDKLCALFQTEAYYLGPFLEKIYLICVFIEIALLITYYMLGKKNQCSFISGQNASWLGIGLGLAFRASLYNMETLESFKWRSIDIICILLAEFMIVLFFNIIYVKKKTREW